MIAKASSEIESFKKYDNQTAIQFTEAMKYTALGCGDVSSRQCTRSIFVE